MTTKIERMRPELTEMAAERGAMTEGTGRTSRGERRCDGCAFYEIHGTGYQGMCHNSVSRSAPAVDADWWCELFWPEGIEIPRPWMGPPVHVPSVFGPSAPHSPPVITNTYYQVAPPNTNTSVSVGAEDGKSTCATCEGRGFWRPAPSGDPDDYPCTDCDAWRATRPGEEDE